MVEVCRLSLLGVVAAEPHHLQSVSASRGNPFPQAHRLRADMAEAQHRAQAACAKGRPGCATARHPCLPGLARLAHAAQSLMRGRGTGTPASAEAADSEAFNARCRRRRSTCAPTWTSSSSSSPRASTWRRTRPS
eukprot:scaffold42905_cov40-Phaeocystis_antarctica.AAC.2